MELCLGNEKLRQVLERIRAPDRFIRSEEQYVKCGGGGYIHAALQRGTIVNVISETV
jgi:hypothetical protein